MSEESEQHEGEEPRDGLGRLREILFRDDRREFESLSDRVASIEVTPEDVGRVLPEAIRSCDDDRLGQALAPVIEDGIKVSVKRDPSTLADAIYPVIGPAIRKSIRLAMAGLVEGINRTMEHSLSPRGLRWRMEAYRTGRPFAEVVLKHSLIFRVEQVLFIHRKTSLLLQHVTAPQVGAQDPDLVSSMLGAIQDFVIDSFGEGRPEGIAQVDFGEEVLEVAQGPQAILACVVRGVAPGSLRERIEEVLEDLHRDLSGELSGFEGNGDPAPFEAARSSLESLVVEEQAPARKKNSIGKLVLGTAVVALLFLGTVALLRRWSDEKRWEQAVASLEREPGIFVVSSSRTGKGGTLVGLRDPLSRDPAELLREAGLDPDNVETRWRGFHSIEPEVVERRVRTRLEPPPTVLLTVDGERLVLSGDAPHAWLVTLDAAATIPGISSTDDSGLVDVDLRHAIGDARTLEDREFSFSTESDELEPSRAGELGRRLRQLEDVAATCGLFPLVTVKGHVGEDEAGGAELGQRRAAGVHELLLGASSGTAVILRAPPELGGPGGRVTLEVRLVGDGGGPR